MSRLSYELKNKTILTDNDLENVKKQIYDYQYEVEKITKNKNNIMLCDTKRLLFIAKDMKKLEKILRKAEKESKCH